MKRLFMLFSFLIVTGNTWADDHKIDRYNCGHGFISIGMNSDEIKKACDLRWEPASIEPPYTKQYADTKNKTPSGVVPIITDEYQNWIYKRYGEYTTTVVFKNGRVDEIFQTSDRT